MTNEEAIKLINTMLLAMHLSDPSIAIGGVEEVETALDMAISALEHTNTAEWKIVGKTTLHYECSKCGEAGDKWDKYCKHCGRKMTNAVAE